LGEARRGNDQGTPRRSLARWQVRVSELTHAQAVVLAQVNGVYVSTLHGLTPDEHACVERGSLSLAELSRRRRNGNGNGQHQ